MAIIETTPSVRRRTTVVTDEDDRVRTLHPDRTAVTRKTAIFRTYQFIWYILGVVEAFLAFRFVFRLLGASVASPFVRLIYGVTDVLVYPFLGIFPNLGLVRAVFDWAALIAMAVWALLAYAIVYLLQMVKPVDADEVEHVVDNPP